MGLKTSRGKVVWLEVKVKATLDIRESVRAVGIHWSHQHGMVKWSRSGKKMELERQRQKEEEELQRLGLWRGVERNLDDRKAVVCEGDK